MTGNPIALLFLGVAALFLVAGVALVVLQRRMLEQQRRAVQELLEEVARARLSDDRDDASPGTEH